MLCHVHVYDGEVSERCSCNENKSSVLTARCIYFSNVSRLVGWLVGWLKLVPLSNRTRYMYIYFCCRVSNENQD